MLLETRTQHEPFLGAPQHRSAVPAAAPAPRGSPAPPAHLILTRGHQQMANWRWGLWARCPRHPEPLGDDFQTMLALSFSGCGSMAAASSPAPAPAAPAVLGEAGSGSRSCRSSRAGGTHRGAWGHGNGMGNPTRACALRFPARHLKGVLKLPLLNTILQDLHCPRSLLH